MFHKEKFEKGSLIMLKEAEKASIQLQFISIFKIFIGLIKDIFKNNIY